MTASTHSHTIFTDGAAGYHFFIGMTERTFPGRIDARDLPSFRTKKTTQGQRSQRLVGIWRSLSQRFGGLMNAVDYVSPPISYENGKNPHEKTAIDNPMNSHPKHEVDSLIGDDNAKFVMKAVGLTTDLNRS